MASNPNSSFNRSEILETVLTFNAIIENQRFLTPAELRLALILIRRGAHRSEVTASARNWQDWTGLDPKSRDLAMRGLQTKCFRVEGRGDRARFRFSTQEWRQYCARADRTVKPHVQQKRAPAKPGQMIHPECRERGCYLARQQDDAKLITLDPATPNRKPVSDFASDSPPLKFPSDPPPQETATLCKTPSPATQNRKPVSDFASDSPPLKFPSDPPQETATLYKNPSPATQNRKPVSNSNHRKGDPPPAATKPTEDIAHGRRIDAAPVPQPQQWPRTFKAITSRFITADSAFLARLVQTVQTNMPDVSDRELAHAVACATTSQQRSAMLYLRTVPTTLQNLRVQQQGDKPMSTDNPKTAPKKTDTPYTLPTPEEEEIWDREIEKQRQQQQEEFARRYSLPGEPKPKT